VFALLVASKAIAQYHGTPFEQPLLGAFRRLTGQLDQTVKYSLGSLDGALSFHPFAPEDADLRAFEIITRALTERRELSFTYRNHGAQATQQRRVQPYHVACIQNVWYVIGFDVGRSGMRTFALTRLQRPVLMTKRFTVPKSFNAQEYLAGSLSVFKGKDDYEVVVDFDAWAADEVRGRRWHRTQELTELPKGMLRLRVRLNNIEEVEKWLLGYGAHATVVRPAALRERLRLAGLELARRYG
jgi:proteasome accessory factor B